MDEADKQILRKNRIYIRDHISNVDDVVERLFSKDVITEGMRQDIQVKYILPQR